MWIINQVFYGLSYHYSTSCRLSDLHHCNLFLIFFFNFLKILFIQPLHSPFTTLKFVLILLSSASMYVCTNIPHLCAIGICTYICTYIRVVIWHSNIYMYACRYVLNVYTFMCIFQSPWNQKPTPFLFLLYKMLRILANNTFTHSFMVNGRRLCLPSITFCKDLRVGIMKTSLW